MPCDEDFNEISELEDPKWNHNNCYYPQIVKLIPEHAETCLDIGCGKGELSAMAAQKAQRVIAVDLAEQMIEKAKVLHSNPNIEYICGNVLDLDVADNNLDAIVTSAAAHHLPYEWLLNFAKDKLKKGGRLIILDLVKANSLSDHLLWGFAFLPNIFMNLIKNGRLQKDDPHAREVWERHGRRDRYMTIDEIRSLADKHIPGAQVKRKLFWRYMLVWQK